MVRLSIELAFLSDLQDTWIAEILEEARSRSKR